MTNQLKPPRWCSGSELYAKLFVSMLPIFFAGCGAVRVIDEDSRLSTINPLNEIVAVAVSERNVKSLECLSIVKADYLPGVYLTDEDHKIFFQALNAHLAPLNYPVRQDCQNEIRLNIKEYRVRDLLIASRLVIEISGSITDSKETELWSASYRLTENAGSVPLDPISAGLGVLSAAKNSSEDSRHNGIYLAVRRLLRALPEHQGLDVPIMATEIPRQIPKPEMTNTEKAKTLADALNLWDKKNYDDALEIMKGIYLANPKSGNGYQFGLMLEAMGDFDEAANVYADTAVVQAEIRQPAAALRTLRRLQRLNEVNKEQHNPQLNRAVRAISAVLKN